MGIKKRPNTNPRLSKRERAARNQAKRAARNIENQRPRGPSMTKSGYTPSEAAQRAGEYFNSLPFEERAKLAPLLEHYRQMGLAEAQANAAAFVHKLGRRIDGIRDASQAEGLTT